MITNQDINKIKKVLIETRQYIDNKYNGIMDGHCIEASDIIVKKLKKMNYYVTSHQGYCLYEYYENCTDQPYGDHVYTLVRDKESNQTLYLDVTLDQFQSQFNKKIPPIVMLDYIPNFILKRRPSKEILQKCGWLDYWDGYRYYNNFDYYSKGRKQP